MEPQDSGVPVEAAVQQEQVYEAPQEQSVPLAALQAERAQRQQLQEEMRIYREQLALMQSNPQQQNDVDDDGDILTKGELKKYIGELNKGYQSAIAEMQITRKYPDYEEVVKKYLPEVVQKNPRLRQTLEETQDYELAYYLATQSDGYKNSKKKETVHKDAERILKNSESPMSGSSVGSMSPVKQVQQYKNMSDDEFRKLMNRNLGQY